MFSILHLDFCATLPVLPIICVSGRSLIAHLVHLRSMDDDFSAVDTHSTRTGSGTPKASASTTGTGNGEDQGSKKSKSVSGSSSIARKSPNHLCPIQRCDEGAKQGSRFCRTHHRYFEQRKYAVEHGEDGSKAKRETWTKKCKDDAGFACREVEHQMSLKAAVSKWKGSDSSVMVQNASWQEDRGTRLESAKKTQKKPFEKKEWVIRRVNKFGWSESDATAEWNQLEAVTKDRDYAGHKGGVRLWLDKGEIQEQSKSQYEDRGINESSDVLKNVSEADREALRFHSIHLGNELRAESSGFLHGRTGLGAVHEGEDAEEEQAKDDAQTPSKRKADAVDGGADGDAQNTKSVEPPVKKLKGNLTKLKVVNHTSMTKQIDTLLKDANAAGETTL